MKSIAPTIFFGLLSITNEAVAHPGHGHGNNGYDLIHYLSEPMHIGLLLVVFAVIGLGVRYIHKKNTHKHKRSIA